MKRFLLGILLVFSGAALAQSPSTSRDNSNLWFNANEPGWGMNVIQQERILFVTIFAYGSDRRPTWFVGPAVTFASVDASGAETFTGDLYVTTGTPFSTAPFDPSSVIVTRVGSITFVSRADGTATVTYSVESGAAGTGTVTKNLTRQTWSSANVAASTYFGGLDTVNSACDNPADNGPSRERADLSLTISGTSLTLLMTTLKPAGGVDQVCRLEGNYTQAGRSGSSTGTVQCPPGTKVATYTLTAIAANANGFNARISGKGDCTFSGSVGGVKLAP
jgi:hypothetical protein